jgi:hypothetical protein
VTGVPIAVLSNKVSGMNRLTERMMMDLCLSVVSER